MELGAEVEQNNRRKLKLNQTVLPYALNTSRKQQCLNRLDKSNVHFHFYVYAVYKHCECRPTIRQNCAVMWSETVGLRTRPVWHQKIGLDLVHCGLGFGLAGLMLCCETRSCHARHHNDLEGHSNFSSRPTIYSFSILCLEHHYCGDQQWRLLTQKLNPPSAFVYFRWSLFCYFGLGLVYITGLIDRIET